MSTKLVTGEVWPQISKIAKAYRGPVYAAVPYFGAGGVRRLNLTVGSVLVVGFSADAVKAGQVDPREVAKAIRLGVKVYSHHTLHAKVYVFGKTAVVGSLNASTSSEHRVEACLVTRAPKIVGASRRFIEGLAVQPVDEPYAESLIKLMPKRPKGRGRGARPTSMDALWLVGLTTGPRKEIDDLECEKGRPAAVAAMAKPRANELQEFCFTGRLVKRFEKGHRVLQIVNEGSLGTTVEPPGRIINIRRYKLNNGHRAMVYVEVPGDKSPKNLLVVRKKVSKMSTVAAGRLQRDGTRLIRNDDQIQAIERVWR